jgi:hypothetical protein
MIDETSHLWNRISIVKKKGTQWRGAGLNIAMLLLRDQRLTHAESFLRLHTRCDSTMESSNTRWRPRHQHSLTLPLHPQGDRNQTKLTFRIKSSLCFPNLASHSMRFHNGKFKYEMTSKTSALAHTSSSSTGRSQTNITHILDKVQSMFPKFGFTLNEIPQWKLQIQGDVQDISTRSHFLFIHRVIENKLNSHFG